VAALPSAASQLFSYETPLCCRVTVVWFGQPIIFALLFPIPGNLPGGSLDLTRELIVVSDQGGCFMTSLSFIECCQLLAVDPKTLRQWLAQAQMSLHAHRSDARIKCLTSEQVFVLANLHDRVLQTSVPTAFACSTPSEAESQKPWMAAAHVDLRTKLAHMEAQMETLQAQITDLTLHLLREREQRMEQRLLALEAELTSGHHPSVPFSGDAPAVSSQPAMPASVCHPTEKRHPLIPLIEYGARGRYVLISPEEGELLITPDSPEWFTWLASLSSFRFVGQQGRFSARRGYNQGPNRCWYAQRGIHQKNYSKYIGVSEHLTTARLEQVAAQFQSYLTLR
jgi:hypothetical protein